MGTIVEQQQQLVGGQLFVELLVSSLDSDSCKQALMLTITRVCC